jgi:hypothetical protein
MGLSGDKMGPKARLLPLLLLGLFGQRLAQEEPGNAEHHAGYQPSLEDSLPSSKEGYHVITK